MYNSWTYANSNSSHNYINNIKNNNFSSINLLNTENINSSSDRGTNLSTNNTPQNNYSNNKVPLSNNNKNINNSNIIIDSRNNNTNNQSNNGSNVNKKCPRNLRLMNNVEPYDIIKDINNLKCNISLSQLVNGSPRYRADPIKGLKLEKNTNVVSALNNFDVHMTMVNNVDHDYISKSREVWKDDIAIVPATVDDLTCRLLVDSGSTINIVSSRFFNSLLGEYVSAVISKGRILQAQSTGEPSQGQLVFLPVKIEFFGNRNRL